MVSVMEQERAFLAVADRHIAEGERHIVDQEARIRRLHGKGIDVAQFEDVLATFRATQEQHRTHRAMIASNIERLAVA